MIQVKVNYDYFTLCKASSLNLEIIRSTSGLVKWIYKERFELLLLKRQQQLNNSLQTTKLKLTSCEAPFKRGLSYECIAPILVDESN